MVIDWIAFTNDIVAKVLGEERFSSTYLLIYYNRTWKRIRTINQMLITLEESRLYIRVSEKQQLTLGKPICGVTST
ncbi:hypothetical protein QE390_003310 [Siphonobacter sp. SORGH_AS 1065]|nr:hypothetical protein [Siphonobacter sp. SORGH_AS_1065]